MKPIKDIEKHKYEKILIGLVRRQKCLYDDSVPKYRDVEHKKQVWNNIAVKCKMPERQCQRTWRTLRDQFNRELKRQSSNPNTEPNFRHYQSMMFIKDFCKPIKRKSTSNENFETTLRDKQADLYEKNSQVEWYAGDTYTTPRDDNYVYEEESYAFDHPNELVSTELLDEEHTPIVNGYQQDFNYEEDTLAELNVAKVEEESYIDVDTFCFQNVIKVEDTEDDEDEDRRSPSPSPPSPKRRKLEESTNEEASHDVNKVLNISNNVEKSTDEYEKFFSSIAEKVRKANVSDDKFTEIQILVLRIIGEMLKLS